jgi:hypothetical protein
MVITSISYWDGASSDNDINYFCEGVGDLSIYPCDMQYWISNGWNVIDGTCSNGQLRYDTIFPETDQSCCNQLTFYTNFTDAIAYPADTEISPGTPVCGTTDTDRLVNLCFPTKNTININLFCACFVFLLLFLFENTSIGH